MNALDLTRTIVRSCLQLDDSVTLDEETYLMGGFPEFNSLTIATMIAEIEDQTGEPVDDDEINGELFETVGSLAEFVRTKLEG